MNNSVFFWYDASRNEFVRILMKNVIIQIAWQPFKQLFLQRCGVDIGKKMKGQEDEKVENKGCRTEKSLGAAEIG